MRRLFFCLFLVFQFSSCSGFLEPSREKMCEGDYVVVAGIRGLSSFDKENDHPVVALLKNSEINFYLGDHQARMTQLICCRADVLAVRDVLDSLPEGDQSLVFFLREITR